MTTGQTQSDSDQPGDPDLHGARLTSARVLATAAGVFILTIVMLREYSSLAGNGARADDLAFQRARRRVREDVSSAVRRGKQQP